MKIVSSEVTIGKYVFPYTVSVEIESSWEMLTDTAKIIVPKKLSMGGKSIAQGESLFKRGDPVTIRLGYDGKLKTIFQGYLTKIHPKTPMEFECEDAMWLLKQKAFTDSYENTSLTQLLTDHCDIPFTWTDDRQLGNYTITNATMAEVLKDLSDNGLYSWVRDIGLGPALIAGLPYVPELRKEVKFQFGKGGAPRLGDIIDDGDLEYIREDDVRLRVKAISMMPDNTKITIPNEANHEVLGDPDGELRTLHAYNMPEADLRKWAEQELKRLKYEGFRGSFSTFGLPIVQHGDAAIIADPYHHGRAGTYLIKKVTTKCGVDGYRQIIELDQKI